MTMIAGQHSAEGIVVVADSRVTWGSEEHGRFQDTLQKIVPLSQGLVLAFAGDIRAVERIIKELRGRIAKKGQLKVARKLAAEVPRIAKHFYNVHKSKNTGTSGVSILVAGRETGGKTGLWVFQSPEFTAQPIPEGTVIIGSGQAAAQHLAASMPPVPPTPTLKQRADALMVGLESALRKAGVPTVGGMFQILTISPTDGIRPMTHGHVDLDPDGAPSAGSMTIEKGKWTQVDLTTGERTELVEPARLAGPTPRRALDYVQDPSKSPKWHLLRFLACRGFQTGSGRTAFKQPCTILSVDKYPLDGEILIVLGFWGTAGEHTLRLSLRIGEIETVIEEAEFRNDYLPEEVEFVCKTRLKVDAPGPAFLEARIDGQLLARRALRFGETDGPIPDDPKELAEFAARNDARAKAAQQSDADPALEQDLRPGLAYFVLCQEVHNGADLVFEQEFKAAYWKTYPLLLKCNIALGFRVPPGDHKLQIVLVDAATRKDATIDTGSCVSRSACLTTAFEGTVVIQVPKPGYYFVNALLDGKRLGTRLLVAETAKAQFSYSLRKEDAARVEAGELLLLAIKSQSLGDGSTG